MPLLAVCPTTIYAGLRSNRFLCRVFYASSVFMSCCLHAPTESTFLLLSLVIGSTRQRGICSALKLVGERTCEIF